MDFNSQAAGVEEFLRDAQVSIFDTFQNFVNKRRAETFSYLSCKINTLH